MASVHLSPVYDNFLEFLVEKATPQEILAFKISEEEQQRAIELLERNNAGTITPEERQELEQMQKTDALITLLKAKALAALNRS